MAAALSWEFPMGLPPHSPPPKLTREELDRKLEEYLESQEDDRKRRPALEKRFEQMTDTVLREVQGLKSFVHDEIRGLKARVQLVEQRTEQITTDSGSWDLEKLKAEMELSIARKENERIKEKLEEEKSRSKEKLEEEKGKPKGILADYGPKILTHVVSVIITAIITYAVLYATIHPGAVPGAH